MSNKKKQRATAINLAQLCTIARKINHPKHREIDMIHHTTITTTRNANNEQRIKLNFKIHSDDKEYTVTLTGQLAKTLRALIQAKDKGITALEVSTWALRLAAYVHILRTLYGFKIQTLRESHPGGYHARYILNSTAEVIS